MKKLFHLNNKKLFFKVLCLSVVVYLLFAANIPNISSSVKAKAASSSNKFAIKDFALGKSRQVILVQASSASSVHVKYKTYEKDSNDNWKLKLSTIGVVGKKGVSANRHEGDLTTPEGIYGFLFAFGRASNPGTKMQYRKTHPGDYWVSTRKQYNLWVKYKSNPNTKFGRGNYEDLYATSLYKYAAALDFNYGKNKIIGKGSAIFMHIAPHSGRGTAGCIGISEKSLVKVLKWMDPKKNPKIIIGTTAYLNKLAKH